MSKDTRNVAVIGLGSMGYGMAASALRGGHKVWGVDIDADRIARFQAEGGQPTALADAADTLDAVAVVVLNAAQTESVLFGEAGLALALGGSALPDRAGCLTPATALGDVLVDRLRAAGHTYDVAAG